jgi:hypothetical protein
MQCRTWGSHLPAALRAADCAEGRAEVRAPSSFLKCSMDWVGRARRIILDSVSD